MKVLPLNSRDVDLAAPSAAKWLAKQIKPTDAVIMLAALTPDKGRETEKLKANSAKNLAMMQHLCDTLGKTGCEHLVYFSSDAVYARKTTQVTDDTPPSPNDQYGEAHLAREKMARKLVNDFKKEKGAEIPLLVLRVTQVYGVGNPHDNYGPNRFWNSARHRGQVELFGTSDDMGVEMRDHIHVDDVAALTSLCVLHRTIGTLNLATGKSRSFREVAELVVSHFPGNITVVPKPRKESISDRHYDVANLLKAFQGFKFVPLEEGLTRLHREMMERN